MTLWKLESCQKQYEIDDISKSDPAAVFKSQRNQLHLSGQTHQSLDPRFIADKNERFTRRAAALIAYCSGARFNNAQMIFTRVDSERL